MIETRIGLDLQCKSVSNTAVTIRLTTKVCRGWDLNYQPSACCMNVLMDRGIAAVVMLLTNDIHGVLFYNA